MKYNTQFTNKFIILQTADVQNARRVSCRYEDAKYIKDKHVCFDIKYKTLYSSIFYNANCVFKS